MWWKHVQHDLLAPACTDSWQQCRVAVASGWWIVLDRGCCILLPHMDEQCLPALVRHLCTGGAEQCRRRQAQGAKM